MSVPYPIEASEVLHLKPIIRERLSVGGLDACWEWKGHINQQGYGMIFHGGNRWPMTRVMWALYRGPLTSEQTIDHLCRNRACGNPNHLEPVSNKENTLRGFGPTAENARKETCPEGHPLDGENLIVTPEGWRRCRECRRIQTRETTRRYRIALAHEEEIHGDGSGVALPPLVEGFSPPRTWNPSGGAGASTATSEDAAGADLAHEEDA